MIGGAVTVGLWARQQRIPLLLIGDVAAPALALGLAVGRIGCQLSGDGDYGVPTDLPWAMSYPHGAVPTVERVHPAPLYELVLNIMIFGMLWSQRASGRMHGALLGQYLVYSGAARFAVEFVRRNPAWLVGLTTAQWMSVGAVLLGGYFVRRARRSR